jgi:predicted dehydrogenase
MSIAQLVTLAPGHFHAALIQKEALAGIDHRVHVYAPLDADLMAHLDRIAGFNARAENPTSWRLEVHAGADWRERFARERQGNVAVIAGRNRPKIDLIQMAVEAGLNVLADKPWIVEPDDFPKLLATIDNARDSGLLLYDMMTERHEITSILQREIVNDRELFGAIVKGDADDPGVCMESVHFLRKQVSGAPLRRPAWFFDISQQGESLADVGTHLVDLVIWTLFQNQPIDHAKDVTMFRACRWPTTLDRARFAAITGLPDFPRELEPWLNDAGLKFFCNNQVVYELRGIHIRLDVLWDYEAPPGGGDTHNAVYRGSQCAAVVRQVGGKQPELLVVPNVGQHERVREQLNRRVNGWQSRYPGVQIVCAADEFHIVIPDAHRAGHESHFAAVTDEFLRYLENPRTLSAWEIPSLLAKYHITTAGVALGRRVGN